MICRSRRFVLALLGLAAGVAALAQEGRLIASVDRDEIHANESFTYILTAEGRLPGRPDLSVLARDFDIVQSGSRTSIQIVNGRTTQVAEWTVELMPRGPGTFELPPVGDGGVFSNAVTVEILPAESADAEAADVFMEVELDRAEVYVQAQAIFTLRLFVGIPTGREALAALPIEGGEAIVESLGPDREYRTGRGGRVYRVRERKFAIFPQQAGVLTIGPVEYQATVIPNAGFSRRQSLLSDTVELTVLPAVAPPASHALAVWLPAVDLRIEETLSGSSNVFRQGVPRTRELTVVAEGLLETQLPRLALAETEGLRQYADQPVLDREVTDGGITATRTDRFAVIANQPGTIELPGVEVPWWNVEARRWEIARVEPTAIEVEPGAEVEQPPPEPPPSTPPSEQETPADYWPWLSLGLALGWAATAGAWVFSARSRRRPATAAPAAHRVSARALLRQLTAACRVNDAPRVRDLLLEWGKRQFPDEPPVSLGNLAERTGDPLAAEIAALESALYGPRRHEWRGDKLLELVKATQSVTREVGGEGRDPLVSLYR